MRRGGGHSATDDGLAVGDVLYAVNPNFEQGTRLRSTPDADSRFNGYHVANDTEVEIVALHPAGFAEVIEYDAKGNIVAEGWLLREIEVANFRLAHGPRHRAQGRESRR